MKILPFYLLLFMMLAPSAVIRAQERHLSTDNKKAEKFFQSAIDYYQARNYESALRDLKKATREDPEFTEAYILQGDIYSEMHDKETAIESYQSAVRTNHPFSPNLYFILAGLQQGVGKYADAKENYRRFLEFDRIPEQKRSQAVKGMAGCDFARKCMADPVPFTPVNLGDSINSPNDEYINAITADEEWLYFTRLITYDRKPGEYAGGRQEDFYKARRIDTVWSKAWNIGPPINTEGNEGALTISPDGNYLFFAGCNRDDGFGRCDIYWSRRMGDRWSVPENLGEVVNSPQWDSQPSFSSDGKTLYFVSNRPGGKGNSDIWTTVLQPDGRWSPPVNLGDSINTPEAEMSPFIHPDNQTLYFSSKGHPGMGGMDLFYSRKKQDGSWGRPVNLGYPINTCADEITLVVNAKGNVAYISSDKLGGKGRQDIYKFPLYEAAQPLLTTYFKGIVFDGETNRKLEAKFELIDLATSATVAESVSDRVTGEFLLALPSEKNYALNVSKEGYLFYSDNFSLKGSGSRQSPYIKNIPLKPVKVGEDVILKNIFFDTDRFTLKDESLAELKKLLDFLKKNPSLRIEISGHTDNTGTEQHNVELSKNRAKAVYDYLVGQGIKQFRLNYAGYGFSRPVDSNLTEEGRANNRRTAFKVIGN